MARPHGFVNTFLCEDGSFLIILNILHETAHKIRHLSYDTLFKQHAVHISFVGPQRKKEWVLSKKTHSHSLSTLFSHRAMENSQKNILLFIH